MSKDLESLRHAYREIRAPAQLAARIRARVDLGARRPSRPWIPAAAAVMGIVAMAWFLPGLWQQDPAGPTRPAAPSLSMLASMAPKKPAVTTPGLSRLRSVALPNIPTRPGWQPEQPVQPEPPETPLNFHPEPPTEKDHAYI